VTGARKAEENAVSVVMPAEEPRVTPAFALALLRVLRTVHRRRASESDTPSGRVDHAEARKKGTIR
jgi:hypothetical protein